MTEDKAKDALADRRMHVFKVRPDRGEPWMWEVRCAVTGRLIALLPVEDFGQTRAALAFRFLADLEVT